MAKSTDKNKPTANKTTTKKATAKKATAKKPAAKKIALAEKVKKVVKKTVVKATIKEKKVEEPKVKNTTFQSSTTKTGRKIEVVKTKAKPPKKIKGYAKRDLNEFKKVILDKREEIIVQLQNLKDQMMDTTTGQYVNENSPYSLHMAEQGTDAQEREKLYLWAQRETKFLGYLEDALGRIESGTYGICIDSLELRAGAHLIPKNRLLAVPHTQHCVDCKNKKKK